jgi:hypothetical protein
MTEIDGCQILAEYEIRAVMQGKRIPKCKYVNSCTGSDVCRRFHLTPKYKLPLVQSTDVTLTNTKPLHG